MDVTAQELVDQLNAEAKGLAALAQAPLPRNAEAVNETHALVYAVLSVERRLTWLGVVLSTPGPHTGRVDTPPVDPDGPRPPTVGDPGYT